MTQLRQLYPPVKPFDAGLMPVSGGHQIYYEQCGKQGGQAALYLHGGPGGGIEDKNRGYFDPQTYHSVLFEQRGSGRSRPFAGLENNTTQDLIEDIERLRRHAGAERWLVLGGSWGSTLALAYAEAHPERVSALVLRGIFLGEQEEIDWLYRPDGVAIFYPDIWQEFIEPIPEAERGDLLNAYHRRLMGPDSSERQACAKIWSVWEGSLCRLLPDRDELRRFGEPEFAVALARLEAHYFVNHCFMEEGQLMKHVQRIREIPGIIVQGRYDMVCPPLSAWKLHRAWPASRLDFIGDAGHSASEPGISDALVRATDHFRA